MSYLVERRSKYGSKSTVYEGRAYHSKFEAGYAQTLDMLKRASEEREKVLSWTPQVRVEFYIDKDGKIDDEHSDGAIKITSYYVDFKVKYVDGREGFHEVKGFETQLWILKWRLLEALCNSKYPDMELKIIK